MKITVQGAYENNLKHLDATFENGLTVVTGVSGSGKSSLVFDTLYHECRRRFFELMTSITHDTKLTPAKVDTIRGLVPAVAIDQNVLNRNPNSTVATALGIHPLLRILYAQFGQASCYNCGEILLFLSNQETIHFILELSKKNEIKVSTQIVHNSYGSHTTLISFLRSNFSSSKILIDGSELSTQKIDPNETHSIIMYLGSLNNNSVFQEIEAIINDIINMQSSNIILETGFEKYLISLGRSCSSCGYFIPKLEPKVFHQNCYNCNGEKCDICNQTGVNPQAASTYINGRTIMDLLKIPIADFILFIEKIEFPFSANRLIEEIKKRIIALNKVDLGYITLDRPSPSLSRGESQRVRIANLLVSELNDLLCVLDEPTIGLHPSDIIKLLPQFKELPGSVVYVEHDRLGVAFAETIYDIGPGAGTKGGEIVFHGNTDDFWDSNTLSSNYFSKKLTIKPINRGSGLKEFLTISNASFRNLKGFSLKIPINAMTIVCGVSGSGKSTLVRDVVLASFDENRPIGCDSIDPLTMKITFVNQDPIGKNSRSNPATYTDLAKYIRKIFSEKTKMDETYFSFNTKAGTCIECNGLGEVEVKLKYLASTWIKCHVCDGLRFNEEMQSKKIFFGDQELSISDFFNLTILETYELVKSAKEISASDKRAMLKLLSALSDIGLGYLALGQPSPSLSGGESQRVKLAKFLGKSNLKNQIIILDEPTTGLHPHDLKGLLNVFQKLLEDGVTLIIVEHNLDLIPHSDWIIELGPESGNNGGELVFMGNPSELQNEGNSKTSYFLKNENSIIDEIRSKATGHSQVNSTDLVIENAYANNLKNISVKIPKNKVTAITGVSGSGKSSLLFDVIETEAKKRFYETLSVYERQGTKETQSSKVENISGLPVTVNLTPEIAHGYGRLRLTVGNVTEISHHLAVLFSEYGTMDCPNCSNPMVRSNHYECEKCAMKYEFFSPKYFHASTYGAACQKCHGVGTYNVPVLSKLIKDPNKPLCKGAMYSPGYFPQGYFCKAPSHGKKMLDEIGEIYGFDPNITPWKDIPEAGKDAFLNGVEDLIEINGKKISFNGFFGIVTDWDVGGTFTDKQLCDECNGTKFRKEILQVKIGDLNINQLENLEFLEFSENLHKVFSKIPETNANFIAIRSKLDFLVKLGLGYMIIDRRISTVSAGEAQRIKIARLLDSDFSNLMILLDEPSRGLHPQESEQLNQTLHMLKDQGNTVLVVEHDPIFIRGSDYLIEIGPQSGTQGGELIIANERSLALKQTSTTTNWISHRLKFNIPKSRRKSKKSVVIKGAKAHTLKNITVNIPLKMIVGICGVSGSGKSVLIVDILSRVLVPSKTTTSVAHEEIRPGDHESISGAPPNTILVDQSKRDLHNPGYFLGIIKILENIFMNSEEVISEGIDPKIFSRKCDTCKGRGQISLDMGFLPNIKEECEFCSGTGLSTQIQDIRIQGKSLPELILSTFDEVSLFLHKLEIEEKSLELILRFGLGYLVLKQPAVSLSGGEVQRMKIIKELSKRTSKKTLFIFDEPSVGLHLADYQVLLELFEELVSQDHSVLIIEHSPELLSFCDYLIEMGPVGGHDGGYVIAEGTPEEISQGNTPTASFLKDCLESNL